MPSELQPAAAALDKGDVPKATEVFDSFIRQNPGDPDTYALVAAVGLGHAHADMAARYAEQGTAEVPVSKVAARANLFLVAGQAYDALGDHRNGIRVNQEAAKLTPDEPDALNGLGYAYAQAGTNLDEALRITLRAVEIARKRHLDDEPMGAIVDSLGWVYYKMGRMDEAIDYLSRAADMAPGHWEIHQHLSLAFQAKGRDAEAKIEAEKARNARTRADQQ